MGRKTRTNVEQIISYLDKTYGDLKYMCGHCGTTVRGYVVNHVNPYARWWMLCPECGRGSVKNDGIILPTPPSFAAIDGLPDGICALYDEARASFDVQAYTGCEILCRKILMAAAVDKDAEENKQFAYYVGYLDDNGYVTPPLKKMAEVIRENGNKAAHEIVLPDQGRAKSTLVFTRRILDTMYGAEYEIGEYSGSKAGASES